MLPFTHLLQYAGLGSAKLSVKPFEGFELEEGDEESNDLMHSVEDELLLPEACDQMGLEEFSVGEEFQNFQSNRMGNLIPLNYYFPDQVSDWVIHKVKEIQHFVEIDCEGYEEQFIALLTAMEVRYQQKKKGNLKKNRELKRSMNLEGSSSRSRGKGKEPAVHK